MSALSIPLLTGCNQSVQGVGEKDVDWPSNSNWMEAKYGDWEEPGVPVDPGPMDHIRLKDYAPRSSVVSKKTYLPKAMYPVIDVHTHNYPQRGEDNPKDALSKWVETQLEVGVKKTIILTGVTGQKFDELVEFYLGSFPDQFHLYCGLEMSDLSQKDFPQRAVEELERCYNQGATGIGELTDKGFGLTGDRKINSADRLHLDDDRLDLFWAKAAQLGLPINIHIADHPSAWQAPDVFQERTPIFQQFNQHESNGVHYEGLISSLPRLLQKHPKTTIIACHLANLGNDLDRLSELLDQHANLFLDISARDYEIGRTPRSAKEFLQRHQNRVLFGTDMGMHKKMYEAWWRLLESDDEYMVGRIWWPYYGLDLSESLLRSLYYENASRILNLT